VEEPDEEQVTPPPSPVAVARRALILSAVVCRANLERYTDEEYRREAFADIHEWFDELALWPHLVPREEKIIRAEFGTLPRHLEIAGTWYVEGLAILAWALRRGDFPPHDRKVDAIAVTNALDFLHPDAAKLLKAPKLRSPDELQAAREWFYEVHVRLRQFLNRGGNGRLAPDVRQFIDALGLDRAEVMAGDGLAFRGKHLADADRDEVSEWEHVICERHRAVMWLEGDEEPFTEISVDT
jgi:Domain of unknown function (DUF4272)